MEAKVPVQYIEIRCCGKFAPCPICRRRGKRKAILPARLVRTIAYNKVVYLRITAAEYHARCNCCKTFRSHPKEVGPRCHYDNRVRDAVIARIVEDGMDVQKLREAMKRDFLLDLSEGFVYDCLHDKVKQLDMAEYRRWVKEHFSGTMCVDELHLGRYTLLLATDPLGDFPVAFALVDKNDQAHMRRFLQNMKRSGLTPEVVITDGSDLYPKLLAELWPEARHQLCVFHVIKDINDHVLDAVRRMRRELSRRGNKGRRPRRGRRTKAQRAYAKRRKKLLKEKAHFVHKHRYLIVKHKEDLSKEERKMLRTMFDYLPGLRTLATFAERVYRLFDPHNSEHQAYCRRAAMLHDTAFAQVPELAKALEMLDDVRFPKMIAFLKSPAAKRIRTNNHVERTNRKLRYYEKVRYKWRKRRNIVRFLLLAIDRWRREHRFNLPKTPSTKSKTHQNAHGSTKHDKNPTQTIGTTYALSG